MNEDTILYTIWAKISALLDVPLPTLSSKQQSGSFRNHSNSVMKWQIT